MLDKLSSTQAATKARKKLNKNYDKLWPTAENNMAHDWVTKKERQALDKT